MYVLRLPHRDQRIRADHHTPAVHLVLNVAFDHPENFREIMVVGGMSLVLRSGILETWPFPWIPRSASPGYTRETTNQ